MILLAGIWAQAQTQTIADFARQERARQAKVQSTRVITTDDLKRADVTAAPAEKEPAKDAAKEPSKDGAKPAAAPAAAASDPIKEWNEQVAKIRARIRELQDQDTATQIEINAVTNKVYAPVTTEAARTQAQAALAAAQKKLTEIRDETLLTRTKLQEMEAQGPAKK